MKSLILLYKIFHRTILVLIIYTLLTAVYHLTIGGFADEPCFVNSDNNCFWNKTHSKDILGARIQAFLTTSEHGYRGGGCRNESSIMDSLEIDTYGTKIALERKNDILFVNGVAMEKGDKFNSTNLYHLDPWIISEVEFENMGLIFECQSASPYRRLVIMGYDSLLFSINKGVTILTMLIASMILVSWKLKAKFLSAIPTILIAYLIVTPCMLSFLSILYPDMTFVFLGFVLYFPISMFVYRKNLIALWVMVFSLFFSGLGALTIGIVTPSLYPVVRIAFFIIPGIYFIFGSYNLYCYMLQTGNERQVKTS